MSGVLVEPARVGLGVEAATRGEAVRAAAELLRGDPRIGPWEEFWQELGKRPVVDLGSPDVCMAHGRGGAVKGLAVSAARIVPAAGNEPVPRLVFVFGIPLAMAEEYLRAVGALVRTCREGGRVEALLAETTADGFASLLEKWIG
jgi:mannitol/fructose-specific phosphotransferase system IIA component (Ntr-type)